MLIAKKIGEYFVTQFGKDMAVVKIHSLHINNIKIMEDGIHIYTEGSEVLNQHAKWLSNFIGKPVFIHKENDTILDIMLSATYGN